jgi:hypothetical protein
MTATGLNHRSSSSLPPIRATIVAGENDVGVRISDQGWYPFSCLQANLKSISIGGGLSSARIKSPSDLFSFSHIRNATRMDDTRLGALRSASSRGVKATVAEQIRPWRTEQSNVNSNNKDPEREAGIAPHPKIGLGIPMSNIFTTYIVPG